MLKIFKNAKKSSENETGDCTTVTRVNPQILNRPNEGEIVKIANIKIPKYLKIPSCWKLAQRKRYYQQYRYFRSPIVLDEFNYLVDGYTTYLLAKELGFEYITILRKW